MYKYIVIFLVLLSPMTLHAQEKAKEKGVASYEKFFKDGMKKIDGLMPVYIDDNKYFLEISEELLGKRILATGVTTSGLNYYDPSTITDIFVFTKGKKETLDAVKKFCSDRICEEGDENLKEALKQSSLQPIEFSCKIVAMSENKKGYIIDITSDLISSGELFSFSNKKNINAPVANRSGVDGVIATKNGVKFQTFRSQTNRVELLFLPAMDLNITTKVEWGLMILPENEMRVRFYDKRVGYFPVAYNEYGVGNSVKKKQVVRKWKLGVKSEDVARYERGELVEPQYPIEFYIDESVPENNIPAIKRALDEWNRCFEAAGFKNVLQIKNGTQEMIFSPQQVLIACSGSTGNTAANTMSDPKTGQRIGGVIVYSALSAYNTAGNHFLMFKVLEPKMKTNDPLREIGEENIRWEISKALGKLLGLMPNIAGSSAYSCEQLRDADWLKKNSTTASIMDGCLINYVIQPTDKKADLEDLYPHPSHYDRWAIEWGYREFPSNKNEEEDQVSLQKHLEKQNNDPFLFYTENPTDTRCSYFDIGSDRCKTSEMILKNMKSLYSMSGKFSKELSEYNKSWWDYMNLIMVMDAFLETAVRPVMQDLNGVMTSPIVDGMSEEPTKYRTKQQQQATMNFLCQQIFEEPADWYRDEKNAQMNGDLYIGSHRSLAGMFYQKLFDLNVIGNMIKAEQRMGKNAYTTNDLNNDIKRSLFNDFNKTVKVSRHKRNMQYGYIKEYIMKFNSIDLTKSFNDTSVALVTNYKDLYKNIKSASTTHTDDFTRKHYKSLLFLMENETVSTPKSFFQ